MSGERRLAFFEWNGGFVFHTSKFTNSHTLYIYCISVVQILFKNTVKSVPLINASIHLLKKSENKLKFFRHITKKRFFSKEVSDSRIESSAAHRGVRDS
jgi:hypothetical protein